MISRLTLIATAILAISPLAESHGQNFKAIELWSHVDVSTHASHPDAVPRTDDDYDTDDDYSTTRASLGVAATCNSKVTGAGVPKTESVALGTGDAGQSGTNVNATTRLTSGGTAESRLYGTSGGIIEATKAGKVKTTFTLKSTIPNSAVQTGSYLLLIFGDYTILANYNGKTWDVEVDTPRHSFTVDFSDLSHLEDVPFASFRLNKGDWLDFEAAHDIKSKQTAKPEFIGLVKAEVVFDLE